MRIRQLLKMVFVMIIIFLFPKELRSQAGQLDTTFGMNGIVNTKFDFNHYGSSSRSTVVQSDGKIVVVGFIGFDFSLVRYNPDGTLDHGFGIDGVVLTQFSNITQNALSAAIQSDDKIIILGGSLVDSTEQTFVTIRYNKDGSLDKTFGTGGITTTQNRISFCFASSIVLQDDGKIVETGFSNNGKNKYLIIVRYNTDGSFDDAFGANGVVITNIEIISEAPVCIQNDGKIIVAGTFDGISQRSIILARFTPNGSLDPTFGINGYLINKINTNSSYASSVALQKDQKIIVGGSLVTIGSLVDFLNVRFTADGFLDNTFGVGGMLFTGFDNGFTNSHITSHIIQDDDKIVSAGVGEGGYFALSRCDKNGTALDNTFGKDGKVVTKISNNMEELRSLAIQNDGKIIAAGSAFKEIASDYAVVRYKSNGETDSTFGTEGIVITRIGLSKDEARSIAIQNDGKILAAGYSYNDFGVARYNKNGDLDISFGTNGISISKLGPSIAVANSVAIQNDGRIIAAGYVNYGYNRDFALVRFKTNGLIDNTFGINSNVTTSIGSSDDEIKSVKIQSDNKIVAAGNSFNGTNYDFTLVRYNIDGNLDATFGTNGIVITSLGTYGGGITSLVIQSDDKIVAVGNSYNAFALVRYNPNGDLDNTFGTNGVVTTQIGTVYDFPNTAALQNDGKIVVAGYSSNGTDNDVAIVRYNTNGAIDNSFGTNGVVTTPVGILDDYANSVAIQSDEKIIVSGYSDNGDRNNFIVIRYLQNGNLDNTFGTNGIEISTIGGASSISNAVAIQNDGNIVAAGTATLASDYSTFTLIRYLSEVTTGIEKEKNKEIPIHFALAQNYPNPFNPTTKIKYSIPLYAGNTKNTAPVQLKIYDLLGREVITLVNEFKDPGNYEVEFNAGSLASGLYFYKLQAGSLVETKKMLLLK
jgi:uncharacterized delta-60 repeat protein